MRQLFFYRDTAWIKVFRTRSQSAPAYSAYADHNSQFSAWNDWGLDPNTTVYFDNSKAGWDKVYVWMWNKDNADYNYPGVDYPGISIHCNRQRSPGSHPSKTGPLILDSNT